MTATNHTYILMQPVTEERDNPDEEEMDWGTFYPGCFKKCLSNKLSCLHLIQE